MPLSIVHFSDPHFGEDADLQKIVGLEHLVPDLQPDAVVISGDLTERARHGEFQAARALVRELERTSPVLVIPGEHDMQWWKRPFGGAEHTKTYENYSRYFGPVASAKLHLTEAQIVGVSTAAGVEWMRAAKDPRNPARRGKLERAEAQRVNTVLTRVESHQNRIAVMHHHVLDLGSTDRSGLSNTKQALDWLGEAAVDLVLCGHAHQNACDVVGGIVVSVAGTISTRLPEETVSSFHRIVVEDESIQVELYRWEGDDGRFRRNDVSVFARQRVERGKRVATGTV